MLSFQLSTGCCEQLLLTSYDDDPHWKEPVVQFLSVKKVVKRNHERYRLIISDGTHFIQGILATTCNALVEIENIRNFTVAVIEKWTCNIVQGKRLVILLSVRILGHPNEKIGEPVSLDNIVDDATGETHTAVPSVGGTVTDAGQNCLPIANQREAESISHMPPIFLIDDLNPYQNIWTVKAQVTQKSDIKIWSNDRTDGRLFSVTLMDESGEIRATAFNTDADELFTRLEEGKVYYISGPRIRLANKKYSSSDYEFTLERTTQIQECHDPSQYPKPRFEFVPLGQLMNIDKDAFCDVIGIAREVGGIASRDTRYGTRLVKRLILVDNTGYSVEVTFWGNLAERFNASQGSVVAIKNIRVGDFGGVSLSTTSMSHWEVDPEIEYSQRLRQWYDAEGIGLTFKPMTTTSGGSGETIFNRVEAHSLNEIKELGRGEPADSFSTQGTIVYIRKENVYYPACPELSCLKKMSQDKDAWQCGKCGTRAQAPNYRYIMNMIIADWSDKLWMTGFDDVGRVIFGRTATELHEIKMKNETEYDDIIEEATCCRFSFCCRTSKKPASEDQPVRYDIKRVDPIDYHEEASYMLELLRSPQWR